MPELTPELIVDGIQPEDPRVSPDGRWVVYAAAPVGKAEEHPRSTVWLAATDGSNLPRTLTAGTANDRAPRWNADGRRVFFTSDRAERGKSQVYRIAIDGGEAEAITAWPAGIAGFAPLPGGASFAFWAKDGPTPEDERRERERDDARVWGERLPVARLRLLDLETRAVRTVAALGDRHVDDVAPRPDGGPLAVVTWGMPNLDPGALDTRVHLVDLEDGSVQDVATLVRGGSDLTWRRTGQARRAGQPGPGADGWELRYVAQTPPDATGANTLWSLAVRGGAGQPGQPGQPAQAGHLAPPVHPGSGAPASDEAPSGTQDQSGSRNLTPALDACVASIVPGGADDPLVVVFRGLDSCLARWDDATGILATLLDLPGSAGAASASADGGTLAVLCSRPEEPQDVWAGPVAGPLRRVSDTRPELRGSRIAWGPRERLAWTAADGLGLDGLLVLPPGKTREDGPFPTITLVHGGPYGRHADGFQLSTAPSAQWLATAGYAVFLPNPRGGMGHGHAFSSAVASAVGLEDWGDIGAGLDRLVADGVADPDRLGIGGWSQGGYMTAWAVGQTDRFKAGVMGAGVSDWGMMVGTSDLPSFEADLGGSTGWDGPGPHRHDALSPISFAHRVTTPVLILHGEADERVPVSQAEFFARALRAHGVPHEYVVYPREPHGVRERAHQIDLLRRTRAWFDRWLRDGDGETGRTTR